MTTDQMQWCAIILLSLGFICNSFHMMSMDKILANLLKLFG